MVDGAQTRRAASAALFPLRVPLSTPRLVVEYYKHDTLPLGMVNASLSRPENVDRKTHTQLLDGRCTAADNCPKGQGFYFRAVIADGLPRARGAVGGATEEAELRLTTVPRVDGRAGHDFSVVSVVAEAPDT